MDMPGPSPPSHRWLPAETELDWDAGNAGVAQWPAFGSAPTMTDAIADM